MPNRANRALLGFVGGICVAGITACGGQEGSDTATIDRQTGVTDTTTAITAPTDDLLESDLMPTVFPTACGVVPADRGCVVHTVQASQSVLDDAAGALTGALYAGVYADDDVLALFGPGDSAPLFRVGPFEVTFATVEDSFTLGVTLPAGDYETLLLLDYLRQADPLNPQEYAGAPASLPNNNTYEIKTQKLATSTILLDARVP